MASTDGYALEHRIVMAENLGRMLSDDEVVHHINHVRTDNRIENLKLCASQALHQREEHAIDKPKRFCACGKKFYARGLCVEHYRLAFRNPLRKARRAEARQRRILTTQPSELPR